MFLHHKFWSCLTEQMIFISLRRDLPSFDGSANFKMEVSNWSPSSLLLDENTASCLPEALGSWDELDWHQAFSSWVISLSTLCTWLTLSSVLPLLLVSLKPWVLEKNHKFLIARVYTVVRLPFVAILHLQDPSLQCFLLSHNRSESLIRCRASRHQLFPKFSHIFSDGIWNLFPIIFPVFDTDLIIHSWDHFGLITWNGNTNDSTRNDLEKKRTAPKTDMERAQLLLDGVGWPNWQRQLCWLCHRRCTQSRTCFSVIDDFRNVNSFEWYGGLCGRWDFSGPATPPWIVAGYMWIEYQRTGLQGRECWKIDEAGERELVLVVGVRCGKEWDMTRGWQTVLETPMRAILSCAL